MTRRGEKRRDPVRLGGALGRVLSELGHGGDDPVRALLRAWDEVVDATTRAQCEPAALRGGVLEVAASSPAWSQHLLMRRAAILAGLRERLGERAPTEIRLRVR